MTRLKPNIYIMPSVSKPYRVQESGEIKKIVFSCEDIRGKLNGQDILLIGKNRGQHTIDFDNDIINLDLTLSSPTTQETGYIIVYKEYKEKYQKSNCVDDLEGV